MRLRTEFTTATIEHGDATFTLAELGTTRQTEIAILSRDHKELSLLETFLSTVVSWSNVHDLDGKELECNEVNKKMIFEVNQDLVEALLKLAGDAIAEAVEAQKKI